MKLADLVCLIPILIVAVMARDTWIKDFRGRTREQRRRQYRQPASRE